MIITHLGGECFKVQFGDTIIALNPPAKDSKLTTPRFGADIAIVTTPHKDMNGGEAVAFGDRKPFIIAGPGEYEIGGVFIRGFLANSQYGGSPLLNTVYTIVLEGMTLCFLGAVSDKTLPPAVNEAIDDIDILFVPIGGEGVLNAQEAYKMSVSLEPKIVIPMHFEGMGSKDALKTFLKEAGENPEPQDKLTLKKKDLEGKKGDVMILRTSDK